MAGRNPKYKSAAEMSAKIEEYFASLAGEPAMDDDGKPMTNKYGAVVWLKPPRPPTIPGIALALGFSSRQSLLNYQAKEAFADVITRAKTRVEQYAAEMLYDRDAARGAEFTLRCNFGWRDDDNTGQAQGAVIVDDIPKQ